MSPRVFTDAERRARLARASPVDDVGTGSRAAIDEDADALAHLIGDVRFKVRFPAPMQKRLYG